MPHGIFVGGCCQCRSEIWLPQALYDAARHSERISFYCPYGHPQVFAKGETDLDVMRRERDIARQQIAQRDDEIKQLQQRSRVLAMQVDQHKTAATKARKRAAAGLCPCCNRSFASTRMAAHIRTKHPDFRVEDVTSASS